MGEDRIYTDAERKAFLRAARGLVRFAKRTRANIYMDAGHLNLMSGDSHDLVGGGDPRPRHDRVVESVSMAGANIGGGDW